MAVGRGQEVGAGLPSELPHVRDGHGCVTLHTAGSHLGLWLFPGSHPVRNLLLLPHPTPGQLCGPADQEPSLPDQSGPEVLSDVLSVHSPETLPSHSGRI